MDNLHLFFYDVASNLAVVSLLPIVSLMRISGHKTQTVFDPYNIVSESDLAEGANRIENGSELESGRASGIVEENTEASIITEEKQRLLKQ